MSYRLRFHPQARRDFLALDRQVRDRIAARLDSVADDPRSATTAPLRANLKGLRKLRVGPYRVAYVVDDDEMVVTVTDVGHRRSIYRRARRR